MKAKRVLAMILAAMMVLSCAACGNKKPTSKNPTSSTSSSEVSGTDDSTVGDESTDGSTTSGDDILAGQTTGADGSTAGSGSAGSAGSAGSGSAGSAGSAKTTTKKTAAATENSIGKDTNLTVDTKQEKMFAAALKGKTVKVSSYGNTPDADQVNYITWLQKKYGLSVKLMAMGWEEMQNNIGALVAAGTAPDLCGYSEVLGLRYAYGNLAQPIDRYLDKTDPVWKTNDSLGRFTYAGKCYGAAQYGYDVFLVYYNKTLFNEKHVTEPYTLYKQGKWTFDAMRKAAKDMTILDKDGKTVKTFGLTTWNYSVFMAANGGHGITSDSKGKWSVTIGNATDMKGLQVMHDISADGSFLYGSDGYAEFRQRKVAMTIERPFNAIGNYDYYNRMDDDIGMVPMPMSESGKYYAPVVSDGNFVTSCSKLPLGAVAYMYEQRIYQMKKLSSNAADIVKVRRKMISDEHLKIYNDYMKKATVNAVAMDGLANWWDGAFNRNKVWDKIIKQHVQPSQAVDSIKGLMIDSLKRTVGTPNVVK